MQLSPERVQQLAAMAPVYRFGSAELEALHRKNRDHDHRYKPGVHEIYVVVHGSCLGSQSFRTLNIICGGNLVPYIHDIPDVPLLGQSANDWTQHSFTA